MRVRRIPIDRLTHNDTAGWSDPERSPYVEDGIAYVPVREGFPCDMDLPERDPYPGRGFQKLGDMVVFHGPRPSDGEIDTVVSWADPRGVLWISSVTDVTRTPDSVLLWGESGEVCHHENGCRYWLDPSRIMFAAGNREERARMGCLVSSNERVGDLCAGIGYFTIPMARAGARVHAMELNPLAYQYLLHTVAENRMTDRVQAECGDCRTLLTGIYDRMVIGHFDSLSFLPIALQHARPGSVIHLHTIDAIEDMVRSEAEAAGFSPLMAMHRVKKYAPGRWHVVWDVMLR